MKLWQSLYALIWIVLLEFMLVYNPWRAYPLVYVHIALGLTILGIAYYNMTELRKTRVPGRVKRTANATFSLSILMAVLGVLLYFEIGSGWVIPGIDVSVLDLFGFVHFINAFAIITQAAAVAIAYDMWEDREFLKETQPGEVPRNPAAKAAVPAAKR